MPSRKIANTVHLPLVDRYPMTRTAQDASLVTQ